MTMLANAAYKSFIALSKKKIHVEISDVVDYYETKPGDIWKDVDIKMGRTKYDEWTTIESFRKYLIKKKSTILEEIADNLLVTVFPKKYLLQILKEVETCQNNFIKREINKSKYRINKNIIVTYRPKPESWTPEEYKETKSSHSYPSKSIDIENKKNTPILEYIAKYSDLQFNALADISKHISNKIESEYGGFSKPENKTIGSKVTKGGQKLIAFNWTDNPEQRSLILHELLKEEFIDVNTDFTTFHKAFSGSILLDPLNIKWIKTVKGKLSKPLILYMFDYLIDNKFIVDDLDDNYYKRLSYVFCDHNSNQIKNWAQSEASRLKRNYLTIYELVLKSTLQKFKEEIT